MTSFFDFFTPLAEALIVALVLSATGVVVTLNGRLAVPMGNDRLETVGCATEGLLLDKLATIAAGAAPQSRVAVPVTPLPPVTGFGVSVTDLTPMGRTVSVRSSD